MREERDACQRKWRPSQDALHSNLVPTVITPSNLQKLDKLQLQRSVSNVFCWCVGEVDGIEEVLRLIQKNVTTTGTVFNDDYYFVHINAELR